MRIFAILYFKNGQRIPGELSNDKVIYEFINSLIRSGLIADYVDNISWQGCPIAHNSKIVRTPIPRSQRTAGMTDMSFAVEGEVGRYVFTLDAAGWIRGYVSYTDTHS